ncbi:MAG TPA: nitrate reductase associated protein [Polyangiaceae bacterium]|nr:nitrate reductase associated protein [Polyangiaceae bacterium]
MIYAFEEIGPDLARPPLAARRALLGSGVAVPLETWLALPLPARQAIIQEGMKEAVSEYVVKNAVSPGLKRVRFMGPVKDPPLHAIPQTVVDALRKFRPITLQEWQALTPLDRYALVALSGNSRLLWRAVDEMTTSPNSTLSSIKPSPWVGPLAHAELHMGEVSITALSAGAVQDGKAIVLARTAGVRIARRAHEILDGHAEKYAGPVELDARLDFEVGSCVWQAHVSTADGEFFAAASLLAAATAAVALRDAIAARDPGASLSGPSLREEAWSVGSSGFGEEATVAMDARRFRAKPAPLPERSEPLYPAAVALPPPAAAAAGVPAWLAVLLVLTTLLALAAAGVTMYTHRSERAAARSFVLT